MRVALVHDWLVQQRGGEQVLLALASKFPKAPIYTLVAQPNQVDPAFLAHEIKTSFLQKIYIKTGRFRPLLPLFPRAIESFDLRSYDLIVSTSHCVAKGVLTTSDQTHLSYVHSPMRYLWDQMPHYLPQRLRSVSVPLATLCTTPLRRWDVRSATRPTRLIANSRFVQARMARVWGQPSDVIYPPIDTEYFRAAPSLPRNGLLVVTALVHYKRVDLAIQTAQALGLPLTVVGTGPELSRLRALSGPTVTYRNNLSRHELRHAYATHQALLFCGEEDFGMVPVEAMAAGCPVLGLGRGGLLETVVTDENAPTGALAEEATVASFVAAYGRLTLLQKERRLGREALFSRVASFDRRHFWPRMKEAIARAGVCLG